MHQQRRGERERGRKGRRGVCMYMHACDWGGGGRPSSTSRVRGKV